MNGDADGVGEEVGVADVVGVAVGVAVGVGEADGEMATLTAFPFFHTNRPFCRTHR